MSETLSVRISEDVKERLEALDARSKRSKSFLAAEAITAYVDAEEWQLSEIRKAMKEMDRGQGVGHDKMARGLRSWGKPTETNPGEARVVPAGAPALDRLAFLRCTRQA